MNIIDVNLSYGNMSYTNKPKSFIVHHIDAEGANWTVQTLHKMHREENGWAAIGYHYYIRLDGSVYRGRPDSAIGAHCQGANTNTLGIAFEGNYDIRKAMPNAQYAAWCSLRSYLNDRYGKCPVYGHREKGSSTCPGKYFPLDKVKTAEESLGSWIKNEEKGLWWYKHSDGSYTTKGWENINDKWYYFDINGWMVTGWLKDGDRYYYLYSDGSMATGWVQLNNVWFYLLPAKECQGNEKEGQMLANCTRTVGGVLYRFDESGRWIK